MITLPTIDKFGGHKSGVRILPSRSTNLVLLSKPGILRLQCKKEDMFTGKGQCRTWPKGRTEIHCRHCFGRLSIALDIRGENFGFVAYS